MDIPTIPDQMFLLIILVIVAIVLIIIVAQWRSVAKSKNEIIMLFHYHKSNKTVFQLSDNQQPKLEAVLVISTLKSMKD